MKNSYMVECSFPVPITPKFMSLIPRQRNVINKLLAEGQILSYSVSVEKGKLWMVMVAESEFDVTATISDFPIIDFLTFNITELMFHNTASSILAINLN